MTMEAALPIATRYGRAGGVPEPRSLCILRHLGAVTLAVHDLGILFLWKPCGLINHQSRSKRRILKVKGLAHFETSISVPYFNERSLRPWQMKNISKYSSRV